VRHVTPPFLDRRRLTVHLVGARMAETSDLSSWEQALVFRLPDVREFTFIFVGPELK